MATIIHGLYRLVVAILRLSKLECGRTGEGASAHGGVLGEHPSCLHSAPAPNRCPCARRQHPF
jgi:hypothetical protein